MKTELKTQLLHAVELLKKGEVIAYPTEAVYGLGCDPFDEKAVEKLFHVKQRPVEKGVILAAASVAQIQDWVDLVGCDWEQEVLKTWPGPVTWVLPVKQTMPDWITGGRDSVAIRVSDHPVVQALCLAFGGPIVSTSANVTTQAPAKTCEEVKNAFKNHVYCVSAQLGGLNKPTQIREAITGKVLR